MLLILLGESTEIVSRGYQLRDGTSSPPSFSNIPFSLPETEISHVKRENKIHRNHRTSITIEVSQEFRQTITLTAMELTDDH